MKRGRPKKNKEILNQPIPSCEQVEENLENIAKLEGQKEIKLSKEQIERKDKLNNVLRELNLKFKDPQMCKYAKDEPAKESLPFRIKEINDFLGGGAVYGNFVIFWGSEGVGKCVEGETLIITDRGIKKIKDLPYKKDGYTKANIKLITPLGILETSHIFRQEVEKYSEIILQDGSKLVGTLNHPVLTDKGFIELSRLSKKDKVFVVGGLINLAKLKSKKLNFKPKYSSNCSNINKFFDFPNKMSENLAFVLGYHLGDGNHNDKNFVITFGDKQKMNSFIGKLRTIFGKKLKYNFHKVNNVYCFNTQNIIRVFCEFLGHKINKIEDLEIPTIIFEQPKEIIASFIYGLLSADGYISKKGISISLKSSKVIYQLQQILLYLGIRSEIRYKYNKLYNRNYATLNIGRREEVDKLTTLIFKGHRWHTKGFVSKFKCYLKNSQGKPKRDNTYFVFSQKVISNKLIKKPLKVYDVTVPNNHIFIGNGIINHNTTLCFEQIIQAQLENKNCVYIDMEHTLDKERAQKIGVNLDNLIIVENAETAEQAMDITIKLAREKCVDLLIIDSLQAMSPKGEQFKGKANTERSMDDNNIALLARKMSEFLRRTCSAVYKGKMAVILIGQARTGGIGGFATHEELTGGRATKFYSLLTVNMRKGQGVDSPVISEKKEVIEINEEGDKVKVKKVVKTKIGFDAVLTINKTKKSHSQPELSTLHIPYYFSKGFYNG